MGFGRGKGFSPVPPAPPATEDLTPNADGSVIELKIYPAAPATHYDKVQVQGDTKWVGWDRASWGTDLYYFTNPVARQEGVKNVTFHVYCYKNNPLAKYRVCVKQNGTIYDVTGDVTCPCAAPGDWNEHIVCTSPATGCPWTIAELDALEAGLKMFDSGIPSAEWCDVLFARVNRYA